MARAIVIVGFLAFAFACAHYEHWWALILILFFGELIMVIEWLFMGVLYSGHGALRACRARQLSLFLGNPTCLNWPDCPNVYLVEEGVVFYGKRSGIEKYLSKFGLKVSLLEENV